MEKKSFLYTANLFIRSIIFTTLMWTYILVQSFLSILGSPFPLRYRYAMITRFLAFTLFALKAVCKVNYKIEGLENIPKDRAGIILCKHQSTWETFLLPTIFHEPAIILKRELLWVPFFGWGLATVDPIAIDRSKKSTAMEQIISKGRKCLKAGRSIVIFPEGTRIPFGKVGKYRPGGARLAVETGYPIIPIAHDAGRLWPKRGFIKKPGTVHLVIGPVIETKGRRAEEVMEQVRNWIEGTVQRINDERKE